MKYVDMNEVAFDPTSVVFPGLGNCHGIIYINEFGLFAYHAYGIPQDSQGRHEAFGSFVRNHIQGGGKGVGLYGACPSNRYTYGDKDHKAELKVIADALKYTGKIKGCRWNIEKLGWRTTYCEYQYNRMAVTVQVADFSTGQSYRGANPSGFNHKSVTQTRAGNMHAGLAFPTQDLMSIGFSSCKALDDVITRITPVANAKLVQTRTL
jgi:hypothetical protein